VSNDTTAVVKMTFVAGWGYTSASIALT